MFMFDIYLYWTECRKVLCGKRAMNVDECLILCADENTEVSKWNTFKGRVHTWGSGSRTEPHKTEHSNNRVSRGLIWSVEFVGKVAVIGQNCRLIHREWLNFALTAVLYRLIMHLSLCGEFGFVLILDILVANVLLVNQSRKTGREKGFWPMKVHMHASEAGVNAP